MMLTRNDRDAIDGLFERLADAERKGGPRDAEAEALIRDKIARQPAAPYYLAQTVVVQQDALNQAEQRIEELEAELGQRRQAAGRGPWDGPQQGYGSGYGAYGGSGGFLAGAAQTALGVAGGVLLGSMIGGLFGAGSANAAEAPQDNGNDTGNDDNGSDAGGDDFGGGDGGGFDGGGFDMGGDF
jgi:hypothetical protein